jgi:hypothetical protein
MKIESFRDLFEVELCYGVMLRAYSLHFLKSSAPLVPPKPKELDMAYSMEALRA